MPLDDDLNLIDETPPNDVANAFARLFNTEDGQTVLGYLAQHTFMHQVEPDGNHSFYTGRISLMQEINKMMQRGKR